MTILYIFLTAVVSATAQSVTGFGYGVVSMAALPLVMSPVSAVAISGLIGNVQSVYLSLKSWKHINYRIMLIPLISSVISAWITIRIVVRQPDELMKKVLGVFLIGMALYLLFLNDRIKIKANVKTGLISGVISGVANGLFGMGGPVTVMYMMAATKDKEEYLSTTQCLFLLSGIFTTIARLFSGIFTVQVWKYSALSVLGMFIGLILGNYIFKKITQKQLNYFVYGFMMCMGLIIIVT